MKWGVAGLIIMIIVAQAYRFSGNFKKKETREMQIVLSAEPCQKLQRYPTEQGTRMSILLSNCWSMLRNQAHYPKEVLFPHDFGRRFQDFRQVYDIAINNRASRKLSSHDQAILSSILHGDEMRRIQGFYFLCAHPAIISQVNWEKNSSINQFNRSFLQSCQQNFIGDTGLRYYFSLSPKEQHLKFQENF